MFAVWMMPGMIWLEFVWFPSLFTALLFRGGLLMRLFHTVAFAVMEGVRAGCECSGERLFPHPSVLLLGFLGTLQLTGQSFLPEATTMMAWSCCFW